MSFIYPEKQLRHQVLLEAGIKLDNPLWQGTRITWILNQAQRWLQLELIRQGYHSWITIASAGLVNETLMGIAVSRMTALPLQWLKELPPINVHTGVVASRAITFHDQNNFFDIVNNPFMRPTARQPIGFWDRSSGLPTIIVYPETGSITGSFQYHKEITDLNYDNNTVPSEIPIEHIPKLIEKVVADIRGINQMDEKNRQAKLAVIDKEIKERYQLGKVQPTSEAPDVIKKVIQ